MILLRRTLFTVHLEGFAVFLAGLMSVLGWAFGSANLTMLGLVGLAMAIDVLAGSIGAVLDPLREYKGAALTFGMLKKMFFLLMVPTAALVDRAIANSALRVPDSYETVMPVTMAILAGLFWMEIISIAKHFKRGGVNPALIAVITRHMDRMWLGEEPPRRRRSDQLAVVAEAEKRLEMDEEGAD